MILDVETVKASISVAAWSAPLPVVLLKLRQDNILAILEVQKKRVNTKLEMAQIE